MSDLLHTSRLLASGYSADEIRRLLRRGDLVRVRRGAYVRSPGELTAEESHHRLVQAALRQHAAPVVVSHQSAAVLHGLPVWAAALDAVHLTRPRTGGGKVRGGVELHASALRACDVTEVGGLLVTTLARTVVDLARNLPVDQAVSAGDAALRQGLPPSDLVQVLVGCRGWPGVGRARRVIGLLDGRSESVGRLLRPGQEVGEVVYREKLREDALRDLGWRPVRWTWPDLYPGVVLVDRLRRALC